jgi:hypothetical protein
MQKQSHQEHSSSQKGKPLPKQTTARGKNKNLQPVIRFILWAVIFTGVVLSALVIGSFGGYQTGLKEQHATLTLSARTNLDEQYTLALQDIAEKRFEAAYQRLDFIVNQDPGYPGATDRLAEVMAVIYATATPTELPPTQAPTPTPDLRPVAELFDQANTLLKNQNWTETIDTLTNLRKADPSFQTARVDGMMFISLRMRGFDKIWKSGDLEGGIYDFALASNFGPLDAQSISARDLARLYLIGSSFWEVDPAQAMQYFSQVAAAAPGMIDSSGWTASARYRAVVIQFADKLAAANDWCNAQKQYELALTLGSDATTQAAAQNAALKCSPPSATPTVTGVIPTTTPTATIQPGVIPTATSPVVPTDTVVSPTNTNKPPTNTLEPTAPPPSETPVPVPTETPVPAYPSPTG